jgi:hypothetical protein
VIVHHDSGQRTLERRGYSSRPVGSCGTICTSVTTDASKITCRRRACAKHAAKVEQPRRIALPLAADTSDTRCGSCPSLEADWSTAANADRCTAFRKLVRFHGATAKDGYYERLPECRAAEVRT